MNLAAFLDLSGEHALIVGGGAVALRRARTLLDAKMKVQVVAPEVVTDLRLLEVVVAERPYQSPDLEGVRLVVVATNRKTLNDEIAAQARAAGLLVNHAGDAGRGNFRFPAVTEQAGVQVAVSTGRELPMLAQELLGRIKTLLPDAEQLAVWQQRRETALSLGAGQGAALQTLRADIALALGARA
ncbi:bifunctional precorrin-2 dehydrogenase/sirohydrochlorin ferrochelatase [Deinococcus sp.]|uniref:precorrin-2 dehydrogenase/sirohydrochlorin ferrochelatase family protein n=1 Tax=Deinococcus sp. TaxID=47478 RepID=UPI0025C63D68|nr:bifunctional precorrin-2 dehydrogenase/sirohydrochlorin ferrochelatase [Deinococcus sp.]